MSYKVFTQNPGGTLRALLATPHPHNLLRDIGGYCLCGKLSHAGKFTYTTTPKTNARAARTLHRRSQRATLHALRACGAHGARGNFYI